MTKDEVKNKLPLNSFGDVHMELFNCAISIDDFINKFNGESLTYESLSVHENATTGWQQQFDKWKQSGILS